MKDIKYVLNLSFELVNEMYILSEPKMYLGSLFICKNFSMIWAWFPRSLLQHVVFSKC